MIVLPKIEDAKKIRSVLERHGFSVVSVCNTASSALASASELGGGVMISGYRLPDMNYLDLADCLPKDFELLLLASARVISEVPSSILSVQMPMKAGDLVILTQQERKRKKEKNKPKTRSWREQNYISNAKMMLMQRNHLSEEDAYRYIQKSSMDSGTNMVETAQMLLMLFYEE